MSSIVPKKPKNIQFKKNNDSIAIIQRWLNFSTFLESLFTFLLSLAIFGFLLSAFKNSSFLIILIAFILTPIGVFSLYYAIAMLINKTYIFADDKVITVSDKPLPWLGLCERVLKLEKLENLYLKSFPSDEDKTETIKIGQQVIWMDRRNESIHYYEIRAKMYNGTDRRLIKINKKNEALFIEKTLESHLNLQD